MSMVRYFGGYYALLTLESMKSLVLLIYSTLGGIELGEHQAAYPRPFPPAVYYDKSNKFCYIRIYLLIGLLFSC